MTLYYSPVTRRIIDVKQLWILYEPIKARHRWTEFLRALGYSKIDGDTLEALAAAFYETLAADRALLRMILRANKRLAIENHVFREVLKHPATG